jgi:hypothetical protein
LPSKGLHYGTVYLREKVIVLDGDDVGMAGRLIEVYNKIKYHQLNINCQVSEIVQNPCVETWLLGNRLKYPRLIHNSTLKEFTTFYNVHCWDPEKMPLIPSQRTIGRFHARYLKLMLNAQNIYYSKTDTKNFAGIGSFGKGYHFKELYSSKV